jgi:hypothetical protein
MYPTVIEIITAQRVEELHEHAAHVRDVRSAMARNKRRSAGNEKKQGPAAGRSRVPVLGKLLTSRVS